MEFNEHHWSPKNGVRQRETARVAMRRKTISKRYRGQRKREGER